MENSRYFAAATVTNGHRNQGIQKIFNIFSLFGFTTKYCVTLTKIASSDRQKDFSGGLRYKCLLAGTAKPEESAGYKAKTETK